MALPHSITRLLINSRHLHKSLVSKLQRNKLPAEYSAFCNGYEIRHKSSITTCLPTTSNSRLNVSIIEPIRLYKTQQLYFLDSQSIWNISRRYKGHSKWQNIQHQKAKQDLLKSKINSRHVSLIIWAIKENGNITDPKQNISLARAIKDAEAADVQKGTIDNAIKRAKDTDANVETVIEIRGPGNTFIIAECFAKHKKISEGEINGILKRAKAGMIDNGFINTFKRQGIIVAKAASSLTLDNAEEDAIECGAEEVEEIDTTDDGFKIFQFQCSPLDFPAVKDALTTKLINGTSSYEILSASVNYVSIDRIVELNSQKEKEAFKTLIEKLNGSDIVTGVYHNCNIEL